MIIERRRSRRKNPMKMKEEFALQANPMDGLKDRQRDGQHRLQYQTFFSKDV